MLVDINQLKVGKKARFWIYTLSKQHWTYLYEKFVAKEFYISSFHMRNIIKGDVIIFCQKDQPRGCATETGFVAIGIVDANMTFNEKRIKIFKDNNMNKHFASISHVSSLHQCYKIIKITKELRQCKEFTSEESFRKKYIIETTNFIQLPDKLGHVLFEALVNIFNADNNSGTDSGTDSDKSSKTKSDKSSKTKSDNSSKSESDKSSKTNKSSKNKSDDTSDSDSDDTSDSDSDNTSDSDSDNTSDSDSDNTSDSDSDNTSDSDSDNTSDSDSDDFVTVIGNIPVLMIPCQKINLKDSGSTMIKNFKQHYGKCQKCDIYNNNQFELLNELDKRNIEFEKLDDCCDLDDIYDKYINLNQYVFEFEKKVDMIPIKLVLVNDPDNTYYKCFFVVS